MSNPNPQPRQIEDPYADGYEACARGVACHENPFDSSTEKGKLWSKGWVESHNDSVGSKRCYQSFDDSCQERD